MVAIPPRPQPASAGATPLAASGHAGPAHDRVGGTHSTGRPGPRRFDWAVRLRVRPSPWLALLVGLLFLALLILERPYQGIRHDAILYTVQALHDLHPENFRNDLFFAFGSQDQWTLYGKLYARLIAAIGVRDGNLFGLAVAQLIWWSGLWRLMRRLLPAPWHWIAVLFVIGMPADYADKFAFFYAEPYLTARVPAEGMCLWALSFAIDRRLLLAFVLAVASMTLHPLNGAVGFAAVLLLAADRFPWWRLFAGLLLVFTVLQYATPAWFAVHRLDATWRGALEAEVDYLFPPLWTLFAWSKACWVIALPLILHANAGNAAVSAQTNAPATPVSGLWGRLALIGLSGMFCATVVGFGGHDALWLQLQTWRVLWLLSVLQWPALFVLLRREWGRRPALLWWLFLCWLTLEVGGGIVALAIAALLHAATLQRTTRMARVVLSGLGLLTERYKGWLTALSVPACVTWTVCQVGYGLGYIRSRQGSLPDELTAAEVLLHSRFMAALIVLLCVLLFLGRRQAIAAFCLILCGLLTYGAINFDQRAATMKIMESRLDDPSGAPFAARVSPGKLVYWDGPWNDVVYPWLLMRTASYFSPSQASGIVFHRETTFEALRRAAIVGATSLDPSPMSQAKISGDRQALLPDAEDVPGKYFLRLRRDDLFTPLGADGIRSVCEKTAHDAARIDFIVSTRRYDAPMAEAEWDASASQRFWLYDCAKIDTSSVVPPAHARQSPAGAIVLIKQPARQREESHAIG